MDLWVTFGFQAGCGAGQFGTLQGCKIHPLVASYHYISGQFSTNRWIGHKLVIRVNSCQSRRGPDTHFCECGPRALGSSHQTLLPSCQGVHDEMLAFPFWNCWETGSVFIPNIPLPPGT